MKNSENNSVETVETVVLTLAERKALLPIETQDYLDGIEESLFETVTVPLIATNHPDVPTLYKAPKDVNGIYKTNGGNCLGVMGANFSAMQPDDFYQNILSTVLEFEANLDLTTLEFREWLGGSNIEFSIKMHPISFKNNKGIEDITNMEVIFGTSYNGSKSNTISLFTERLVCTNGMVANKLQGTLKNRNTEGGKEQILSYASELAQIINGAEGFKEKMMELDKRRISRKRVEKFKLDLFGFNQEYLDEKKRADKVRYGILEDITEAMELEFGRTGQTAFGLLQGVTYYTNHLANNSKKGRTVSNSEYIRFNQGFKTNTKAQELVYAILEEAEETEEELLMV